MLNATLVITFRNILSSASMAKPDAVSGIPTPAEVRSRMAAGWAKRKLSLPAGRSEKKEYGRHDRP
jgi:hypothetical protein